MAAPASAALSTRVSGTGPPLVLVHGGLPARLTWACQSPLEARWSVIVPSRRGFAPSPAAPLQDFLADADDLAELVAQVPGGAHLVGFSYGGVGLCIVAERMPHRVRSLTLIEVPLWSAADDDDSVQALMELADRFAASAEDEQAERDFMALAGVDPASLGDDDDVREAIELARRIRSPREARPGFDAIAAAGIPTLVASGDHHAGMERLCDAVAARLGARRARLRGAGHAVQRAPGFNRMLEEFLTAAERGRGKGGATHDH
jgi:pimeloyl-ACP methyl ester carboxylesterase